jgi:hypothetical protein
MPIITPSRVSARFFTTALAATALAAAGVLAVAAPASAVTNGAEITLGNTSMNFVENNWGGGISFTGEGFVDASGHVAHAEVGTLNGPTFTADPGSVPLDIPVDGLGAFTVSNWIPSNEATVPASGLTPAVQVTYLQCSGTSCEFSEEVTAYANIVIAPFVPADPTITITPSCSTVDEIGTEGFDIVATGFLQFENVTVSVTGPDGEPFGDTLERQADIDGTVSDSFTLTGDVPAGEYTAYVTGGIDRDTVAGVSGTFEVGSCTVPAAVVPEVPEAPAAPTLANTGSADAGLLAGGSALLLLLGAALLITRRRAATVR